MDDRELLRDYVERQSEKAFSELVARHVNLVYATALRIVGEPAAAQDVVQTVFILLARKAWTVRDGNALLGWLYRAAYRAALDAIRSEQRRRERETEAMILTEQNSTSPEAWEKLAPLLDEAMQRLNPTEQDAVLLRYFEGKTLRETGDALGVSEPAAQMRVSRALEKMRAHFARGGVTVAVGALAVILTTNTSKAAPVDLAARVTGPSLAGAGGAGSASILLRIFFMSTKTKIALVVTMMVLIVTITFVWQSQHDFSSSSQPGSSRQGLAPTRSTSVLPVRAGEPSSSPARVEIPIVAKAAASAAMPQATQAGDTTTLRADLKTAIPEFIRILEDGDYVSMVQEMSDPAQRPTKISDEQSAEAMQQDPAFTQQIATLIQRLKSIQNSEPQFDASGDQATYTLAESTADGKTGMVFVRVDGLWYMRGYDPAN